MTVKKQEAKEEAVEMTFEETLKSQITALDDRIKQTEATIYQLIGALNNSKGLLEEYKKTKE